MAQCRSRIITIGRFSARGRFGNEANGQRVLTQERRTETVLPKPTPMNPKILSSSPVRLAFASVAVLATCISSTMAQDPLAGFVNKGLVGMGRVPANSFDRVRGNR